MSDGTVYDDYDVSATTPNGPIAILRNGGEEEWRMTLVQARVLVHMLSDALRSCGMGASMGDSRTPETPTPRALLRSECPYGDPYCPCQDGDACHYEGDDPMTPPVIGDTDE